MVRAALTITLLLAIANGAYAQITTPAPLPSAGNRIATLEEQLVNRLRATATDQRNFITFIVNQVEQGNLDIRLVVAVERYALRRNRRLPFPFFERSIRFVAAKFGITVPPVRTFARSGEPLVTP